MSVQPEPPDHLRCQFLWKNGNQCREYRESNTDHGYCRYHYDRIVREAAPPQPWPAWIANEVLPADTRLDSATAVNDTLTRLLRVALEGHISVRSAGSLGYVVQHILTTLPGLQREATDKPKHAILGRDPDAAILHLADSLQHAMRGPVQPPRPGESEPPAPPASPEDAAPQASETPQVVQAADKS